MSDKAIYILLGTLVLLVGISFVIGVRIGRGSSADKVKELEGTIDGLNDRVTELDATVATANSRIEELEGIQREDRATIDRLTTGSAEARRLVSEQGALIIGFERASQIAGETSSGITLGLGDATKAVDELIQYVEERKN